jgi:uncharacterized protein YciI
MIDEARPEEESRLEEHSDYLARALDKGRLVLAGPCLGGMFGVVVLRAGTAQTAKEFLQGDPAVEHGLMTAELHSFRVLRLGKPQ